MPSVRKPSLLLELARVTHRMGVVPPSCSGCGESVIELKDGWIWLSAPARDTKRAGQAVAGRSAEDLAGSVLEYGEIFGLDFALVMFGRTSGRIVMSRGGVGTSRLFFKMTEDSLSIYRDLRESLDLERINQEGFVGFLGAICVPGPYDLNHTLATVCVDVLRVPRSEAVIVDSTRWAYYRRPFYLSRKNPFTNLSRVDAENALCEAIIESVHACIQEGTCGVELSGGIDSTLVAESLRRSPASASYRRSLSIVYPFHEFRYERSYMDQVFSGGERSEIAGEKYLPFDAPPSPFFFDEPNLAITGIGLHWRFFEEARRSGLSVLFHGVGGDQIFANDPRQRGCLIAHLENDIPWVAGDLYRSIREEAEKIRVHYEGGREAEWDDHFLRGTLLYDAWLEQYVGATFGVRHAAPLVHPKVVLAAHELFRREETPYLQNKEIVRRACHSLLPEPIRTRRGKVSSEGVMLRGLRRNRERLEGMVRANQGHLGDLGIKALGLVGEIERLSSGDMRRERGVLSVLSYLTWRETQKSFVRESKDNAPSGSKPPRGRKRGITPLSVAARGDRSH